MQRSILDRIYLFFLLVLLTSFIIIIVITSISTRRTLSQEKVENLRSETKLVANQTIAFYLNGDISKDQLSDSLHYYGEVLNADFWYTDTFGRMVAISNRQNETLDEDEDKNATKSDSTKKSTIYFDNIPRNIYEVDKNYKLHEEFVETGNFYELYSSDVVTINMPLIFSQVNENGEEVRTGGGTLICHASITSVNSLLMNIYGMIYIPCLCIILVSFTLLWLLSNRVIQPVKKLSTVAKEYSQGNFGAKTGIDSNDEIGQLAKSMEYMADELSKLEQYRHDFISNISHDFRSPLTSIKGYVEAIQDGTIPPEMQDRYLGIVLNETQRLTKLTQGLLDLNNFDMYGQYLKLSKFDVAEIINPMLNTFEIKCIEKNIAIYLNNSATDTIVYADQTKIQQVIYNLIDNALKFTPMGKRIFITITEQGDKILISVKDEGIGMDENTIRKIWTRFYKGDASRGKNKQSSGLGLAIIKEIIRAHNENIDVTSKPGEGSDFFFTLTKASAVKIEE